MTPDNFQDTEAPKVNSRALTVSNQTASSFTISWERAADNETSARNIRYVVMIKEAGNSSDPWHKMADEKGITTYTFTGLKPETTYAYYVKAYDEAGNVLQYPVDNGSGRATTKGGTAAAPAAPAAATSTPPTNAPQSSSDNARKEQIRQGFLAYANSGKEQNVVLDYGSQSATSEIQAVTGGACLITCEKKDIDRTPKGELFPENDHFIYPGCLVYADEYLAAGTPRQVNFGKARNFGCVRLSADFITSSSQKVVVSNATSADVKEGIAQIMRNSFGSNYKPSGQYSKNEEIYTDTKKMAIDANCSVDFLVKCDVKTTTKSGSEKIYKMHKITQQFYKITAEIENGDLASLFGPDVTWADIKAQIDRNGPIAIIKEVTYGRYGYYFDEYEKSSFNFVGSQKISYKKQSIDLTQDIDNVSTASRRWGYVYGGSATTAAEALANYDNFAQKFNSTPVVGPNNQARPISYTVIFLSSNKPCKKVNTGTYYDTVYKFCPNKIQTDIENIASVPLGGQINVMLSLKTFKIVNHQVCPFRSNVPWQHEWNSTDRYQEAIRLPEGEYFYPTAGIKIMHKHGAGPAFSPQYSADGDVDISNGMLKMKIKGSAYMGQDDPMFEDAAGYKNLI